MITPRLSATLLTLFLSAPILYAQEEPTIVPGRVFPEDFSVSSPLITSTTGAVVLADVGSSSIESYEHGWRVVFKRLLRIKILNNSGLDLGSVKIFYSGPANKNDKIADLLAYTYNLNDGKVEVTPVDPKDFFLAGSKKSSRLEERFAFPNMKPGSIIEYSYSIRSYNIPNLIPWTFQGDYPRLWSEYSITVPDMFNYAIMALGNVPFYKTTLKSVVKEIWVGNGNMDHNIFTKRWMMKDVPPIKKEDFVSSSKNYVARLNFQISSYPGNFLTNLSVFRNWGEADDVLMRIPLLGGALEEKNRPVGAAADQIVKNIPSKIGQARALYTFVRDQFHCTYRDMYLDNELSDILSSKEGSTADLNLLLVALLRKKGFTADPVILSTRDNGLTNLNYPLMDNFNYTICRVEVDGKFYFLDASEKFMGFGRLPNACYNGHARVIKEVSFPVFLQADTLHEHSATRVVITGKEGGQVAQFTDSLGYYASLDTRKALSAGSREEYFKTLKAGLAMALDLEHGVIDSLDQYDQPVVLHYDARLNAEKDSVVYFDPFLGKGIRSNPFVVDERKFAVELASAYTHTYSLDMEVPKGYVVEEMPRPDSLSFNKEDGKFNYTIENRDGRVRMECRLVMNIAIISPELYNALRDFYAGVIKKEAEMIVLKKVRGL